MVNGEFEETIVKMTTEAISGRVRVDIQTFAKQVLEEIYKLEESFPKYNDVILTEWEKNNQEYNEFYDEKYINMVHDWFTKKFGTPRKEPKVGHGESHYSKKVYDE